MLIRLLGCFPWYSNPKFHPLNGIILNASQSVIYEQRKQAKKFPGGMLFDNVPSGKRFVHCSYYVGHTSLLAVFGRCILARLFKPALFDSDVDSLSSFFA